MTDFTKHHLTLITTTLTACVALLAVTAVVLSVLAFTSANSSIKGNCNNIEEVKTSLRQIIGEAKTLQEKSPVRSKLEKEASTQFYTDTLGRLKGRNC